MSPDSRKYPFDPFYGGVSPRVAVAWSPKFDSGMLGKLFPSGKTVIRGGYSRIYTRMNGINLVQVPLAGHRNRAGRHLYRRQQKRAVSGGGRRGPDQRIPHRNRWPDRAASGRPADFAATVLSRRERQWAGSGDWKLDPNLKPGHIDQFDFTIQREMSSKARLELGYVGSRSRRRADVL